MKTPLIFEGDTRYTYSSGVIRGLENFLLTPGDYQKVFDVGDEQLGTVLAEIGYGGGEHNPEHALDIATQQLLELVEKLSRHKQFTDTIRLKYDFKNAQIYLKAHFFDEKISSTLPNGTIEPDSLFAEIENLLNGEIAKLPKPMDEGIEKVNNIISSFNTPVAVDIVMDNVYYRYLHDALPQSEYFIRWFAIVADWINTKSFVRIVRSQLPINLFPEYALDGGDIPLDKFYQSSELDTESIPMLFANTEYGNKFVDIIKHGLDGKLSSLDFFPGTTYATV
ncbi:hypothetical protein DRQ33_08325 [bacterium]|nr:MAG: hypothetical protein DRQ33_08325 [bacterium]